MKHFNFVIIITASIFCFGFTSNILPEGLPPNLPAKINGKYRVIEKCGFWSVYDFKKYTRTNDGFKFYPPVYTYIYDDNRRKWFKMTENSPMENMCSSELVSLIEAGAKLGQKTSDGKQISSQDAVSKVALNIKNPSNWKLSSKPFKNTKGNTGFIICGKNTVNQTAIGVWWCNGSKVTSVNGIAKGNTPIFEMTYDVSAGEGLSACGL